MAAKVSKGGVLNHPGFHKHSDKGYYPEESAMTTRRKRYTREFKLEAIRYL